MKKKSRAKNKGNNKKKRIISALIISTLLPLVIVCFSKLEGSKPTVDIGVFIPYIGASGELNATISDTNSGLRSAWVALSTNGKEKTLLEKQYDTSIFSGTGKQLQDSITITIEPKKLGFSDGKAKLRIRISDNSWRGWLSGNVTYIEKEITIDTQPPEIEVLSTNHNLKKGGSGLIIYRIPGTTGKNGVLVENNFFPGYSGYFDNAEIYLCFFALTHKQGPSTNLHIEAFDAAGNMARSGLSYYIGNKVFKKDTIRISDNFLNTHMPSFQIQQPTNGNLEKFLYINREMRKQNGATIMKAGEKPDKKLHWENTFKRLPGAAHKAAFADYRSYFYNGKKIDNQYHLGIDLASVKHDAVPAANNGRVALTANIGIYGKTVVIDHGFGLFTTYSHLSSVNVTENKRVKRGDILGRTGVTGLVGGDHLHYGMFVHNTFVNPIEWWDATWIKNNITSKLHEVRSRL